MARTTPSLTKALAYLIGLTFAASFELPAQAQEGIEGVRPSDERPALPALEDEEAEPSIELPPIEGSRPPEAPGVLRIWVARFEVLGSTVFSSEQLDAVTAPYSDRWVTTSDLVAATQALTQLYVSQGYVTSEAFLPDQDLEGSVIRIEVVEGGVSSLTIEGNRYIRDVYLRSRIMRAARTPLNVRELVQQLELLQRAPQIERITAVLGAREGPGENPLQVHVSESFPLAMAAIADNHRSPSIGSTGGGFDVARWNLIGLGDTISLRWRFTEGLRDVDSRIMVPITPYDTQLSMGYRYSESDVVDDPFSDLNIDAELQSAFVELRQPLIRSRAMSLWAGITGEWRESRTRVLGRTFCFQAGVLDCKSTVAVIRVRQDFSWRSRQSAVAARSTLSFGLNALGATNSSISDRPDSEFFAWLGQLQWAQIIPLPKATPHWLAGTQVVARADVQLAGDPLLSIEQIAVGGARTVRGYRQNLLVRDNGAIGAIELRVPVLKDPFGRPQLEIAPFFDAGHAWNESSPTRSKTLTSIGVGLRLSPTNTIRGEFYWGYRLNDEIIEGDFLQRNGFHFRVVWNVF